jgi:hypothetical protein
MGQTGQTDQDAFARLVCGVLPAPQRTKDVARGKGRIVDLPVPLATLRTVHRAQWTCAVMLRSSLES